MSDWITVTKKNLKEENYSKNCNLSSTTNNSVNNKNILENTNSHLSFENIADIFEDEYGNYIEEEITNVCNYSREYCDFLKNINTGDIEYFFYNYINKEESIPQKYKEKPVETQEPEIYSDEDY